jgi:hypothetical protein
MSVAAIIRRIDEVIRDPEMTPPVKIQHLQELARACWREVVPEGEAAGGTMAGGSGTKDRWAAVRREVERYDNKAQILYVLDWPASGGDFRWVK